MAIFRPISWGRLTGLALASTLLFGAPPADYGTTESAGYRFGYFSGAFVIYGAVVAIASKRELN